MKRIITLLLLFSISIVAFAEVEQNKAVLYGSIVDKETQESLPFATVLICQSDSSIIASVTCGNDGAYKIDNITFGEYLIKVSLIGYKDIEKNINIKDKVLELPTIEMEADVNLLNEVVVTGKRPLLEQKIDKLIMNVSEVISARGGNSIDLLRRAPGVMIRANGDIFLNGNKVDIWIDGRPSYLTGKNLESLLLSTNASTVDKIEIMAHPSAKYDAKGSGGIINIKTKKNFFKGFNGTLSGSYGGMYYDKYVQTANGSVNLGYRSNKTNTVLMYSPRYEENVSGIRSRVILDKEANREQLFNADYLSKNTSHSYKLGNDWFIDDKNVLGVIVQGLHKNNSQKYINGSYTDTYVNGGLINRIQNEKDNSDNFDNITANLNYSHIFNKNKGKKIEFDTYYSRYNLKESVFQTNTMLNPIQLAPGMFNSDLSQQLHVATVKIDYEQYFWKSGMLEAGGKWSMTNTDNDEARKDFISDNWIDNTDLSNEFKYNEQIGALYVSVAKMFNRKWTAKLGGRVEYTYSYGDWKTIKETTSKNYINFFPNLYIGYTPYANLRFSFSYARRIERPSFNQLNPFRRYVDANTAIEGNPGIEPQFVDQLTLNVGYKTFLNVTALYFHTTDLILQNPILDPNNGNTLIYWSNLGSQNMIGCNISISEYSILNWMKLNASLFASYNTNRVKTETGNILNNNGFMSTANASLSFLLPKTWTIEFGVNYQGKVPWGYFEILPQYYFFGGITKNLLDNKATLTLNINDIFRTQNTKLKIIDQNGFAYNNVTQYHNNQKVILSFTYRFGKMKASKRADIDNKEDTRRIGKSSSIGNVSD